MLTFGADFMTILFLFVLSLLATRRIFLHQFVVSGKFESLLVYDFQ